MDDEPERSYPLSAGANLVGSDLYNKLSGYFVQLFQSMIEVSGQFIDIGLACSLRHVIRNQKTYRTSTSCDITLPSGIDAPRALTTSTVCSLISIVIG